MSFPIRLMMVLGLAFVPTVFQGDVAHAGCDSDAAPGVDWSGCRKRNLILGAMDVSGATFDDADMIGSDLRGLQASGAKMRKAHLSRANASEAVLREADLTKVEALRAVFDGADLNGANLGKAEMFRSSFRGAILDAVDMSKGEFGRVDFTEAAMTDVDLSFANLSRAVLTGATLDNANMTTSWTFLTRFEGTDLSRVRGLTQAQVDLACGDETTVLPEGLTPSAGWPCGEE